MLKGRALLQVRYVSDVHRCIICAYLHAVICIAAQATTVPLNPSQEIYYFRFNFS